MSLKTISSRTKERLEGKPPIENVGSVDQLSKWVSKEKVRGWKLKIQQDGGMEFSFL